MPDKKKVWYGSRGPFFVDSEKTYPDGSQHTAVHIEGLSAENFLRDYTVFYNQSMPEGKVLSQISRPLRHEQFIFKCINTVTVTFEIMVDDVIEETIEVVSSSTHIEDIDILVPENSVSSVSASYTSDAPQEAVITLLGRLI